MRGSARASALRWGAAPLALSLAVLCAGPVHAGEPAFNPKKESRMDDMPAGFTADEVVEERDLGAVVARGHVEVDQGGRILKADVLSYLNKQDIFIATGNVSLTEVNGEVTFADYMELSGDMREAAAKAIRILQMDDSRLAGASGRRFLGNRQILNKGVYTACEPCDDPTESPVWVIKGRVITHDEITHLVEYEDAWLEMLGVPLAYTPYLSHPDPTIKRASGLLPPSMLNNQILGSGMRTPYFWDIDPGQDLTVTPLETTNGDLQMALTYRLHDYYGEQKTVVSVTDMPGPGYAGKSIIGWHIDSQGRFDLDPDWRVGWSIQKSSDAYYLQTFGYQYTQPFLTVAPYAENFDGRSYAYIGGYGFQSLTQTLPPPGAQSFPKDPMVFPVATYNYVGLPNESGGYLTVDTHGAVISRFQGSNTRQINTLTSWHQPFMTADGELFTLSGGLRLDGYDSNGLVVHEDGQEFAGRALPFAAVEWRYPFTKVGDHSSQTITPIIMASASPGGANPERIPDEDSLDFELNDRNIFSPMPSSGFDRIVSGPRVAYGAQYTVVNRGAESADFLIGQSFQQPQTGFLAGTGLDHHLSDIVGRADISPSGNFQVQYRFRLNEDGFGFQREELSTSIGPKLLNLQTSYVFFDKLNPAYPFDQRQQLQSTLSVQLTPTWSTNIYTIENLGQQAGNLQSGMRLTYEDECFLLTVDGGDRNTTSKIFSLGHYLSLRIVFKTLGQLPLDIF